MKKKITLGTEAIGKITSGTEYRPGFMDWVSSLNGTMTQGYSSETRKRLSGEGSHLTVPKTIPAGMASKVAEGLKKK